MISRGTPRPVATPLVTPCCHKPSALYGRAFVTPTAEDVTEALKGQTKNYLVGGVHWCECGMAWRMRDLVREEGAVVAA